MSEKLPIICSAHHASDDFHEFADRCALSSRQRLLYSDYGTEVTVPRHRMEKPLIATHSRGVVDLNRESGSPTLFPTKDFAKPTPNEIWRSSQKPSEEERAEVLMNIYHPYHRELLERVMSFKRPGIVVAWDNTSDYEISNAATGEKETMPPVILSNRGTRDSTDMTDDAELDVRKERIHTPTCDPRLLAEFAIELQQSLKIFGLPDEVFFNRVYKGGFIAEHYNTERHPELDLDQTLHSFQVEYNTRLTHDQETLKPNYAAMAKLRIATERALFNAYANVLTWNI